VHVHVHVHVHVGTGDWKLKSEFPREQLILRMRTHMYR